MTARCSSVPSQKLAFTTDSYVIQPLFFPGGDIGTLAVNGTVNDLAMCGARPLFLSAGFILEEGLPMDTLWRVVQSMKLAAEQAGVQIVTGDTKVVDRGKGDGIFINTAGIGVVESSHAISPANVQPGDAIILSGDIGRHGIAIMAVREGLEFESTIESDCAALSGIVLDLIKAEIEVHCLRDLTRGGLASALIEIAEASRLHFEIEESAIPMLEDVKGACEILGFDPLYVANEGRFISFVPAREAERTLRADARTSAGRTGLYHRNGKGRQSRPGDDAQPDRRNARRGHAQRRATPAHLLNTDVSFTIPIRIMSIDRIIDIASPSRNLERESVSI